MLKKFLVSGAVIAGFSSLGLAAPAQAESAFPPPVHNEYNIAHQNSNTAVCGNGLIDNVAAGVINLAPVTATDSKSTGCNVTANQN